MVVMLLAAGAATAEESRWSQEQQKLFGQSITDFSRSVGMMGFIWGMPIFEFAVAEYRQTQGIATDNSSPHGLFGYFNGGKLSDETTTWFGAPNPDVLYASTWLYLKDHPYVVYVPPMDDIWYNLQFQNYFSVDEGYLSSRTIGQDGGYYLVTYKDWNHELPTGIKGQIVITTPTVWALTRIAATKDNEQQRHNDYELKFKFIPLDAYLENPTAAKDYVPVPQADIPAPIEAKYAMRGTLDFFRILNFHLRQIEVTDEQGLMAMFDSAGFGPHVVFDPEKMPKQILAGLEQAAEDGLRYVDTMRSKPFITNGSGWSFAPASLGTYGKNYILRAISNYGGIGANIPAEAVYPSAFSDSEGRILSGDYDYSITFPKGQTPPGQAFWSISLMDATTRFMVANPIHRNNVGSTTKGLRYNPDGSLTVYISSREPKDPTHRANWLPSKAGVPLFLLMRIYQPTQEVLDGKYLPPPIVRIDVQN